VETQSHEKLEISMGPGSRKVICGVGAAALLFSLLLLGWVFGQQRPPQALPLTLLFLGNSYTEVNSLPDLVQAVAVSAGYARPVVQSYTPGGYTFEQHLADPAARALIEHGLPAGERWNAVVLQNQSEIPAYAYANPTVRQTSLAGAVGLYRLIKDSNPHARIVLFETWARNADLWRTGGADRRVHGADPDDMQMRLRVWYEAAARAMPRPQESPVAIARIGDLWEINYHTAHPIPLHAGDGSHPDFAGSYVAALDIYATVYYTTPNSVMYRGPLPEADAAQLRQLVSRQFSHAPSQ
jgi:hypothetical protein